MILVIGATSFIGMYTTEAFLNAGHEVIATGRNPVAGKILQNFGAKFVELDITDEKAFEHLPDGNIDGVVLLAALLPANSATDLNVRDNAADYFRINVIGTINVLEYCRQHGIKKCIGACSNRDISGIWGKKAVITEEEPRNFPFTGDHAVYIISKNASNDVMEYYNQQYNMRCSWFRLPRVYGVCPHNMGYFYSDGKPQMSGIATFIKRAMVGFDLELWGNPNIKKDMVYVKDVAQAYVQAIESDRTLGLYNISGHMQVSLEDQAKAAVQVFGKNKGSRINYRSDKTSYDRPPFLYSIDKAKRDFGYTPQYTDFVKIMKDYKLELESGKWDEWLNSH